MKLQYAHNQQKTDLVFCVLGVPLYLCTMFVRKKPNKSGSTSVQVVEKRDGRYRVVKSFGSSKEEAEINQMCKDAELYIRKATGTLYDLFNPVPQHSIEDFLSNIGNAQISVVGPELVFGKLYDKIGFGDIGDVLFRHLVISRLFSPGSKLKTVDYLYRYQGVSYDVNKVYRYLDKLCLREATSCTSGIKDEVERITFRHSKLSVGNTVDVVFYDISTLYFEAADEDDLRRTGFSKDGKFDCPQILLGLLITREGNPISYEIFEGNLSEKKTFVPLLQRAAEKFNLGKPVVVADAGLLSKGNINALVADGYEYILGARLRNESEAMKAEILSLELKDGDVRTIKKGDGTRIIVSRTEGRRKKDAYNRQKGLQRLQKRVTSGKLGKKDINNRGYNKYLRLEGKINVSIDMDAYEKDALWDGIKGYVTNTTLAESEVIANYSNLWYIERAFRMNKTDLRVRPIYHRLRNRIEAHICISFAAYVIQLELERMLKRAKSSLTINRARELTKNMYQIRYSLPYHLQERNIVLKMDEDQQELCDLVNNWTEFDLGVP